MAQKRINNLLTGMLFYAHTPYPTTHAHINARYGIYEHQKVCPLMRALCLRTARALARAVISVCAV